MPRYDAYTEQQPGAFTFTGPDVAPVTLTGDTARRYAASLPPAQNVSAPLALTAMSSAPPMASGLPEERSDAVPNYAPAMGPNGLPGASFAPPVRADALDNPMNAPPEILASQAPKEELSSQRPDASFAGDRSAPAPVRRFGPGSSGGGSAAARVDASGGFIDAYNAEAVRQLTQRGGGSAGTRADAWQAQTRQTQVQDGRVGAIPMSGYLGAVGSEGSATERARQESDAIDAQKIAREVEIEQRAAEAQAQAQREAMVKRQDLRASMERITNEANEPDVNPGQWWGEKSTGSAILLGLAAGASGLANGRAGIAGNPVLQSIERAVERDIETQVRNKDAKDRGKQAKLQRLGQLYNLVKEETGDDVQAMNQAKITALTVAQKQLQTKALEADSPLAAARADAAYAAIDRRKAEIVIENERHLQVQKTGAERFVPKGTGASGGPNRLKLLHDAAMTNKEFNPQGKLGESPGEMVLGGKLVPLDPALSPNEREKARAGATFLHLADQQFAKAEQLGGVTGIGFADSDVQSALKSGSAYLSKAQDMGVVTGGEWDVTKEIYRGVGAGKAIKEVRDTIGRHATAHELQFGADKRGQLSRQVPK